jgi:integrase/recombinase XerD
MISNTTLYNSKRPPEIVEKRGVIAATTPSITPPLYSNDNVLFDRKIENITAGLQLQHVKQLKDIHPENALIIVDYIQALKTEINLSDNYRSLNIFLLCRISSSCNNKLFKQLSRQDLLSYLDSLRKPEQSDPSHKWIGTYNLYRSLFIRFFRWLHYPDIEQKKRPKPDIVSNIPQLKRKESSAYKPTDLWTEEDDRLFLKYRDSQRIKCYHTMSRDTSCRPHEILKLKIKDVIFRLTGDNRQQYAEILVNGKTGSRQIPLFNSIPYVKDYLNNVHPQAANPNAILICGMRKKFGRAITTQGLFHIYKDYKDEFFPTLLDSPNVTPEDKQKIKELLKKPWNPYIRRHSALTEKSIILKEHSLRQHAGWSNSSQMPQKYIHYFGNESSESLLQAYGILPKNQEIAGALKPKQCPNCSEPNKPDSKFCAKCRMVLTYDAYDKTLQNEKQKEGKLSTMEEQLNIMQSQMQHLITALGSMDSQEGKKEIAKQLIGMGIYKSKNLEGTY